MSATPNNNWIDRFSLAHFAVGLAFERVGVPAAPAIASHVLWEVAEDPVVKAAFPGAFPDAGPDGFANHVSDVAFFTAGYFTAQYLRTVKDGSVAVAFVLGAATWMWLDSLYDQSLQQAR